ncbi:MULTISPECIES: cytochrome c biogenesis CcdA family protein [Sphingomonadaceae]|jgi:cytochrome c-type biogenesis protein|uniref:cytochrome c biogenesis CcdA family protein n=1 Tax=Sphingomonadales TaxID=204457 RepID=UPI0017A4C852|nr:MULTISPECIES: cytochrome c biogenesis CcdA family protein [Sphingomonadaceae]MBA4762647.1 cytochrome c biogenesis protein CcdA [Sphingomonas sp.]CAH0355417.1 Protein DipZ [Sphingobium sp. CECT 9361]|tara:strand:- start:5947 stop:6672 length:726 start_codon:yes stop_codon:yes gene_type:complete
MSNALNPVLAYAAGALTILSPCVLPLVPIVLGSAAQRHRFGPLALATGLVISFSLTGFALATVGEAAGIDSDTVRLIGAIVLILIGLALIIPYFQRLSERLASPLAGWAGERQAGLEKYGLWGQAGIGALLGLVWSPCVGPTLGAATILASQGQNLAGVAIVMAAFGLGIASVLLVLALAARSVLAKWRGKLMNAGNSGKKALGVLVMAVGLLIITGTDRLIEGAILTASPDWLTDLTTSI